MTIKHRTTLDASHRLRRENSEYYLKSPAEMAALFDDHPESVANTLHIAERCEFDLTRDLDYRFPDPSTSLRAGCPVPEGETPDSYLRKLCYREAENRYGRITPQVRDRLEEELALVERHGLAGFFLIHREILRLAYQVAEEMPGRPPHGPPGRGLHIGCGPYCRSFSMYGITSRLTGKINSLSGISSGRSASDGTR